MKNDCHFSSYYKYNLILEEIRDTIKDRRGITQSLLATELGISREHLNRMLRNEYPMKSDQLIYLILRLEIKGLL